MPSATGSSWEKYKKEFADDEVPEKKITPLTDEYGVRASDGREVLTKAGIFRYSRHMAPHHTLLH